MHNGKNDTSKPNPPEQMIKFNINPKSIYDKWGFKSSPFQTTALPASELGATLLTGRDEELVKLANRLVNAPKLPTVEGLNGVGKTSIANVASYVLYKQYLETRDGPLFIPCRTIFQLKPAQDLAIFADEVLYEVAQTLIERAEETKNTGITTRAINQWLNHPQLTSRQGGFQFASVGINAGQQSETNTSKGYERSGFRKEITEWLKSIFPDDTSGGVVCIVDNLELLQSSDEARTLVEQLRDDLFTVQGLRWVLCGALGIVHGVVASPRMEGYLHSPISIGEISGDHAAEILENRKKAFSKEGQKTSLPLLPSDFAELYKLLRGILRSVLSSADDYCTWVDDNADPKTDADRHNLFLEWLDKQCEAEFLAIQLQLRPSAMRVFKHAVSIGGVFSPSDFTEFGFKGIPQFRPSIKDLEAAGLLVSTRDEGDKRRKTIQVTAKGWKVNRHIEKVADAVVATKPEDEEMPSTESGT